MRARVLLVEDEPVVRQFLELVLTGIGCQVDAVGEGEAAMGQLEATAYDLIVSDVKIPGVDGPALYREAARRWPHLRERFVFVTGDLLGAGTADFLRGEGVPVLQKPFTPAQLRDFIRNRLEGKDP